MYVKQSFIAQLYSPEDCLTNVKFGVVNSGFDLTLWNAVMKTFATDLSFSDFMLGDCNWTWTHNHLVRKQTLNGWVFVYELSGCGFESSCSHLNFRFHTCFKQRVPWHSGHCRVWIHSEMRTWHDKNIESYVGCWKKKIVTQKNHPKP